jgi:hypothetical protein
MTPLNVAITHCLRRAIHYSANCSLALDKQNIARHKKSLTPSLRSTWSGSPPSDARSDQRIGGTMNNEYAETAHQRSISSLPMRSLKMIAPSRGIKPQGARSKEDVVARVDCLSVAQRNDVMDGIVERIDAPVRGIDIGEGGSLRRAAVAHELELIS